MMGYGMMGYGFYGEGGSLPSSSSLSALAPPFTVVPKPIPNPLVDMTESSYGPPLNSSLDNWLRSPYSNSGPSFSTNHNPEFGPTRSPDAYSYPGSLDYESPNSHLPPATTIASASASAYWYGQCSDGMATSTIEAPQCYPAYPLSATEDRGSLAVPEEASGDWFSSFRVPTLDGSSYNDFTQSRRDHSIDWGGSWTGLVDCEHGKQVAPEGSFCSKASGLAGSSSIYKNYVNQGAHASKVLRTCEEASHTIDMSGWEKYGGVSMGQPNEKSFSWEIPRVRSVDYGKTSVLGSPPLLPEKQNKATSLKPVTNIWKHQVPCSSPFEDHLTESDASLSSSASSLTPSPSLVFRPPDIGNSLSALNKSTLEDAYSGTDAADPDLCGNNPSKLTKICPFISSGREARFDKSLLSIHLETNDPIHVEAFSGKNEELSKNKDVPKDTLDQVFKPNCVHQISKTSSDGFNLALDFIEAINPVENFNPVENYSESLDHFNPAVDSPCWKGAPVTCFSPFAASKAVSSQYMKQLESCNSSGFQEHEVFPFNCDDVVKQSSENPNGETVYVGKGLQPGLKRPSDASSLFRESRSNDSSKAGSFNSKSNSGCEVQLSDNNGEPGKHHALHSKSIGESQLKPSLAMQQNFEASKMISEKKHLSEMCVADTGSNISAPSRYGSSNLPFHATEKGLSLASSVEDASAKLNKLHEAGSTPRIDVQMLVNIMRNLSDLLLFHSSNDSLELKEVDREALKNVILNIHRCISKEEEQMIATQASLFGQGISPYLEEVSMPPKKGSVDRTRSTKEAAFIAWDRLDHKFPHEGNNHYIGSSNKMEMLSDSLSLKRDAEMVNNMTQAIKGVLCQNFNHEEEMQPKSFLFKNLWLEAEAELCSVNYKARYHRLKTEMEKSELHKAKDVLENTMDVEKRLRSKASFDLNMVDKSAPGVISIQDTTSMRDVMARYGILKRRIDYTNSTTDLEEVSSSKVYLDLNKMDELAPETAEAKCLSQDMSIQNSPIIGTTCQEEDVMARVHILKCRADNSNSLEAKDVEEPSSSNSFLDLNEVDDSTFEATEAKGALIPDIFTQNPPLTTTNGHADDVEASIMARFHIIKSRDDNLSLMDGKRQELAEVVHFGFPGEKNHRPIIGDRPEYVTGDVKLGPVLQHCTANSINDKLAALESSLGEDDHVSQSLQCNRLEAAVSAVSYDSTSSDWEHVMKEELVG